MYRRTWTAVESRDSRSRVVRIAVATVLALVAGLVNAAFVAPASADPVPPVPAVTYTPGDIDGQNGWAGTGGGNIENTFDQTVVDNTSAPASFYAQSWRFSNSVTSGAFGNQPFSPSVDEAGETAAEGGGLSGGSRSDQFVAEWDFASAQPGAEQPGLGITASPDRGDGARMSWVRMEDTPSGLRVLFNDYQHDVDPECDDSGGFVQTPIATGLARGTAHSVRIEMDFVEGPENDVVRVYVDGSLAHTGSSWEDYFRDCEGNETRTVDSLLFRASGTAAPANAGKGFLIDNVSLTSGATAFSTGFEPFVTSTSATTVVTEIDDTDWFAADTRLGGLLEFAKPAYGGSIGDGAAVLSTTASSSAKVQLFTDEYGADGGTLLSDIDGLSYSTYRVTAPSGSPALPALNLRIDRDNDDVVDAYLVYEPYQDLGNAAVQDGVWQSWNGIRGGAAKWWSGQLPGCGQATPCTWSTIRSNWPLARVLEDPDSPLNSPSAPPGPLNGSLGANLGSGNPGVTAAVDGLTVTVDGDRQIFDFDAIFAPDAPTGLAATPGDGIVDLTWDAPDDGGSPITTYHVYRDGTEVGTTSGDTTFQDTTANGAVPSSVAYSYTVSAENAVGEGDESTAATAAVNLFWEDYEWDVENGTAVINVDGGVDLTRFAAGESWIRLVDPPPINGNGTPWVEFSYHDDGDSWQGIDMFVDSTGLPPNPRLQAGSLFTAERLGYARYTDGGAQEEIVFVSSDNGGAAPRTDGDHTIYVGQAANGRVDYEADGEWSSTDFLIGNGAPFAFNDVLLRWRCSPTASVPWELACDGGETTTFHSFAAGDDHDDDGPGITIDSPLDGGTFEHNDSVAADYACSDAAGVASCTGNVPDGDDIDTSTLGSHTFTVDAVDDIGNETSATVSYTVVDVTGPSVTIVTPAEGATYARDESVLADFACDDEAGGSGLASCLGDVANGAAIDTGTLGSHDFTVTGTDDVGNETVVTHTYTVLDVTAPTVTITSPEDNPTFDQNESVLADYACADEPGGSGIDTCVGNVADGAAVDTSTLGDIDFTVTATDNDGNVTEVTHTYTVEDVTDPAVTITTPADSATFDRGELVAADYACEDEASGSGLLLCFGTVPDGVAIATSTLGAHTFQVFAIDAAGNLTAVLHSYTVVDGTDPGVTIDSPQDGATYEVGESVSADYACEDEVGGSGLDSCVGTVANGAAIDTATLGAHDFTVTATDNAGNETEVTNAYTVVDDTDPEITIATPVDGAVFEIGESVTVDFACTDVSGVGSCVGPSADGAALDTSTPGAYQFTVNAEDNVGNTATLTHDYTVREAGAPTVEVTSPADDAVYAQGQLVIADYACEDEVGGSGIDSCVGPTDDGDPVNTATPGEHDFTVTGTDNDGNETVVTNTYTVDASAPTITITTPTDGGTYDRGSSVPADYACNDTGGSTVAICFGTVPDGVAISTATLGHHSFSVFAMDAVGNLTLMVHSYTVVDGTAPTVTITSPPDGALYQVGQMATAEFLCADEAGGSGLASCVGDVADGADIDTSTVGSHDFTVTATDGVGNETVVTNRYTVVARPLCQRESVTVDLTLGEVPTGGPDVIQGTSSIDVIDALGGDDVVCGLGGADIITLGLGNDVANGGGQGDQISGAGGNDHLVGSYANDILKGNGGNDLIAGGPGFDQLLGGQNNDHLIGGPQQDNCNGGTETDTAQQCEVKTNIP